MKGAFLSTLRARLQHIYLDKRGYSSGRQFTEAFLQLAQPGRTFLDAGCGEGHVRELVPECTRYVGIDVFQGKSTPQYSGWTHRPTVVADLHQLPVATNSCDVAILLHVLEHARCPATVVMEMARVLKPGALLFVAVPFIHQVHHAPGDYFRFTKYALEDLFRSAGLTILSIRPQGGYFRSLGKLLRDFAMLYREKYWLTKLLLLPLLVGLGALSRFIYLLEYPLDILVDAPDFTTGYLCTVRKDEIQ